MASPFKLLRGAPFPKKRSMAHFVMLSVKTACCIVSISGIPITEQSQVLDHTTHIDVSAQQFLICQATNLKSSSLLVRSFHVVSFTAFVFAWSL